MRKIVTPQTFPSTQHQSIDPGNDEDIILDRIIQTIIRRTNSYEREKADSFRAVSDSEIFFSIIYYMGVISLPSNSEYWNNRGLWPNYKT